MSLSDDLSSYKLIEWVYLMTYQALSWLNEFIWWLIKLEADWTSLYDDLSSYKLIELVYLMTYQDISWLNEFIWWLIKLYAEWMSLSDDLSSYTLIDRFIWRLIKPKSLRKICDAFSQNLSSVFTYISRPDDRLRTKVLAMRELEEILQGTLITLYIFHAIYTHLFNSQARS